MVVSSLVLRTLNNKHILYVAIWEIEVMRVITNGSFGCNKGWAYGNNEKWDLSGRDVDARSQAAESQGQDVEI